MIYIKPTVPKRIIELSRNIKLKPYGPIKAPAIIKPIKCGILILLSSMGAKKYDKKYD
jgi:hypothetical protein